jgi:hypothetical protein
MDYVYALYIYSPGSDYHDDPLAALYETKKNAVFQMNILNDHQEDYDNEGDDNCETWWDTESKDYFMIAKFKVGTWVVYGSSKYSRKFGDVLVPTSNLSNADRLVKTKWPKSHRKKIDKAHYTYKLDGEIVCHVKCV